jgi:hypothetical protein
VSIGLRMSPGDERLIATQRELVGERNPRLSTE